MSSLKAEDLGIFRKAALFDIVCGRLAVLLSWRPWCATMELSMGVTIEITDREEREGEGNVKIKNRRKRNKHQL